MTTAFPVNTNQNAHHNTEEYFMNTMMKIWKKYADFTILTKDKKYIFKEDILQNPVLQFYWNPEISEESKQKA